LLPHSKRIIFDKNKVMIAYAFLPCFFIIVKIHKVVKLLFTISSNITHNLSIQNNVDNDYINNRNIYFLFILMSID
jgi:hypothetical protein